MIETEESFVNQMIKKKVATADSNLLLYHLNHKRLFYLNHFTLISTLQFFNHGEVKVTVASPGSPVACT